MPKFARTAGAVASVVTLVLIGAVFALPSRAEHVPATESAGRLMPRLVMPIMNPQRGRKLFVAKGCIACHAINGVGGHDAPNMDAHEMSESMNPFDYAAKMWNHAPAMIAAQEGAMGEQIYFTGAELADIIAFTHDDQAQHTFSEHDLTVRARAMMHHEHGGKPGPEAHGEELRHDHAPGTPPHKD